MAIFKNSPPLPNDYQSYLRRVIADGGAYEPVPTAQFLDQYNTLIAYNPSMMLFPSAEKTLFLYSVIPNSASFNYTSSRSSNSGSYFNSNGVLQFAVPNEPRLTYTVSTVNQFKGVLIEPNSKNWHLHGQSMGSDMPTFNQGGAAAPTRSVALDIPSPSGLYNAALVTGGTGSTVGTWGIYNLIPQGILSGSSICGSIFARAGSNSTFALTYANLTGTGTLTSYFDLSNGTTTTAGARIENWGNGWYRCIMAPFTLSANANASFNLGVYVTPNTSTGTWSTDYTGKTMYFYGIQLENYSFATSYIPTTTTTASRSGDTIQSPLINYAASAWSIFFEIEYLTDYAANSGDVSGDPLIWYFRRLSSTGVNFWNQNAQQTLGSFSFSPANSQKRFKCILSFNGSTINTFINGTKTGNAIVPTNLSPYQTLFSANTNRLRSSKIDLVGALDGSHVIRWMVTYNYQLDDQSSIFLTTL
jgi:hypothetical protein